MRELRVLQSGYLAAVSPGLTRDTERELTFKEAILADTSIRRDTTNFYDAEITTLYRQLLANNACMKDFEYREALLTAAMRAFGNKSSFAEWFFVQHRSPGYTYLHGRYLLETLEFIFDRKQRKMSHQSYARLLMVGLDDSQHIAQDAREKDIMPPVKDYIDSLRNIENARFYSTWAGDMVGLQDMAMTLNVIFGRRETTI